MEWSKYIKPEIALYGAISGFKIYCTSFKRGSTTEEASTVFKFVIY